MPNTSERPADTRKRSPASVSALRSCSTTLREVLGATLRGHLLARIGRQDLRHRVRILRVLHRLHREAGLHRLGIPLAHEERPRERLVIRVLPRVTPLLNLPLSLLLHPLRPPHH